MSIKTIYATFLKNFRKKFKKVLAKIQEMVYIKDT